MIETDAEYNQCAIDWIPGQYPLHRTLNEEDEEIYEQIMMQLSVGASAGSNGLSAFHTKQLWEHGTTSYKRAYIAYYDRLQNHGLTEHELQNVGIVRGIAIDKKGRSNDLRPILSSNVDLRVAIKGIVLDHIDHIRSD